MKVVIVSSQLTYVPENYRSFYRTLLEHDADHDVVGLILLKNVDFQVLKSIMGLSFIGAKMITKHLVQNLLNIPKNENEKLFIDSGRWVKSFDSMNDPKAIQFIKDNPDRYVLKPSGNTPSIDKSLLLLSQEEDGKDLLELLEQNKKVWQKKAPTFILQKYINGVEVAVGTFFNGHDFIYPINVNFEHKRIFSGNIGPFCGEMGTLMYWSSPNNLFKATLEKMLPKLKASGYVGYIDINCIVNGKGIYPLEFTSRFGYPTINIQLEGITMPTGEWLYRLAKGEDFEIRTKRGFQIGVLLVVESMFSDDNNSEVVNLYKDLAVILKNPNNLDGIHIDSIRNDNGIWRIAGVSGGVLVVTGSGTTVSDARHQVYGRIKNIIVPNMFYRTDIGASWAVDSDRLHTWGYLR